MNIGNIGAIIFMVYLQLSNLQILKLYLKYFMKKWSIDNLQKTWYN
jgi:hypothetical protein